MFQLLWGFGYAASVSERKLPDPHASSLHFDPVTLLSIVPETVDSGLSPGLGDCLNALFERGFLIRQAPTVLEIRGCQGHLASWTSLQVLDTQAL